MNLNKVRLVDISSHGCAYIVRHNRFSVGDSVVLEISFDSSPKLQLFCTVIHISDHSMGSKLGVEFDFAMPGMNSAVKRKKLETVIMAIC